VHTHAFDKLAMTLPDRPTDPSLPLPCTGARLRRLTRRVTVFYEQYLRAAGLRLTQYSLLAHLDTTPRSLIDLAEALEMDRTSLTRGLRPLIARGWVRESRGRDARRHLFELSAEGLARREQARAHWAEAQLALEAALDRDFVAQLNRTLEDGLARLKPALPEDN
jgi:DNA-binding MarR family transcriptional regulator